MKMMENIVRNETSLNLRADGSEFEISQTGINEINCATVTTGKIANWNESSNCGCLLESSTTFRRNTGRDFPEYFGLCIC
jgi:signal recognition particle GTPase